MVTLVAGWAGKVLERCGPGAKNPIGVAGFLGLVDDSCYLFWRIGGAFQAGGDALAAFLLMAAGADVQDLALNPKIDRRPTSRS